MSDDANGVSVYLHIPWCLERCPYCDFNTQAARTWPEDAYAAALESELETRLAEPPFAGAAVATIFFGGGTPSLFAPETIGRLVDRIGTITRLADDVEITLETNPGSTDLEKLTAFRAAGVNRLSLGVQTFDDELLHRLGRHHDVAASRRVLRDARKAGFENLSLDLIHAIPGQTMAGLQRDLDEALSFDPNHVSAYALTYEPGTPLTRDLQRGRIERVSNDLEAEMLECIRGALPAGGLAAYEISNYAQKGAEARHNQAYWRGTPYLGVGAGAHSYSPERDDRKSFGRRWKNVDDAGEYTRLAAAKGRAEVESEELTRRQAMGETCWLALRESRGLQTKAFAARYGENLDDAYPQVMEFCRDGLLAEENTWLRLTPRGLLVADEVFASFF